MSFMNIAEGYEVPLPGHGSRPRQVHVFDRDSIQAVDAALAAQRPLLVRGEPGIGKSQLARAVAIHLQRVYVQYVVDARTESRDLLWHYDAVARLADAQLAGALGECGEAVRDRLAAHHYLHPGPLWWAFNWENALQQAGAVKGAPPPQDAGEEGLPSHANGCVVLIDEIDKAESDVPNGLLEALGAGEFTPVGGERRVVAGDPPPLVVVTTNNERALPDAFLRRCLVLHLALPEDEAELKRVLVHRGGRHFPGAAADLLEEAAKQLYDDRKRAKDNRHYPLPGQAEYLDLLRAAMVLKPDDPAGQIETLKEIAKYALKKHPDAQRDS
jgi:MoxR-like ATPase